MDEDDYRPNLDAFGVRRGDFGYIYIVENNNKVKIGKSKNAQARMKAAKTWLPDMRFVGAKPFWGVSEVEKNLHLSFASCWYEGEWFHFSGEEKEFLFDEFLAFSDTDVDMNSVNFIYWVNGSGMSEFLLEYYKEERSKTSFLWQESWVKKKKKR